MTAALVFTFVGSVLPSGLGLSPAFAATSGLDKARADLAQAKKELRVLQAKLDKLARQQVDAENDLENTRIQIEKMQAKLAAAQDDLAGLREQLATRLAEMYKNRTSGAVDVLNVVFSGDDSSLNTLLERLSMVSHIAKADNELIASVQDRVRELRRLKADLSPRRRPSRRRAPSTRRLWITRCRAWRTPGTTTTSYAPAWPRCRKMARSGGGSAKAEEARKAAAAAAAATKKTATTARRAPATTTPASTGAAWVFPVAGPNSFGDTFGAPRSGGRTHKGTDIFTARYTPLVAVENGVISSTNPRDTGLGGITLHLRNGRGTVYYYAHLQSIKSGVRAGVRVKAGQVIGYAGNTGNAESTPVHLHFEIRRNGVAINPFPPLIKYR
jgi:murein DD-endopeptidase MepM/ murein hydrolase activator NlpD